MMIKINKQWLIAKIKEYEPSITTLPDDTIETMLNEIYNRIANEGFIRNLLREFPVIDTNNKTHWQSDKVLNDSIT